MSRISRLAAHVIASAALVALAGSSVFADNRPSRETNDRNRGGYDRGRGNDRGNDRRGRDDRYENRRNDGRGQVQYYSGRVSRYDRYRDGYRVWVGGAPYPFFVPQSHWNNSRFGVGLSIRIGGYYNPQGYYDYYDGGGYYDDRGDSSRDYLNGYVERVDYRRGTFVIRDSRSGRFITVVMRDRDRFFDDLRRGDHVQLSGDWDRGGVFEAYRIDDVNRGRNYR